MEPFEKPTESTVASPCIRNCCLDQNDICLGCFRTLDEILVWGQASEEQKQRILQEAKARKQTRGGVFP